MPPAFPELKHVIVETLLSFFDEKVLFIYLFGSQAAGQANAKSDVDIGVLFQHGQAPDRLSLWELSQALAVKLNVPSVDVVNMNEASTVLNVQIISANRPLFIRDERLFHDYEIRIMRAYQILNDERAEILKAAPT